MPLNNTDWTRMKGALHEVMHRSALAPIEHVGRRQAQFNEPTVFFRLSTLSLKSCYCEFIDLISAIFCAWKKRTGILREARGE